MNQSLTGSSDLVAPVLQATNRRQRIVAVVVTHNRLNQLQTTLNRLFAEDLDAIIVVDNASTDGSTEMLALVNDPRLHPILLPDNRGGAGGFEMGLGEAVSVFDPDWCVVMDDDARPEPGAISHFRAMNKQGAGGVAAAVYTPKGRICDMNRPSVNPFWHIKAFLRTAFGQGRKGFHLPNEAFLGNDALPIDAASFVGLFLSRDAIKAAGLPDGRMFIYGDDVLYTLMMRRSGISLIFAPDLRFEHDFTTFQAERRAFRPLWKVFYHHRNLLFVYHLAAGPMFWPALLVILPKWLWKTRDYKGDRAVYLRLLLAAIWDGMRGNLERSHRNVRKLARHVDPVPHARPDRGDRPTA